MKLKVTLIFCLFISFAITAQNKLEFGDTPTTNLNPKYKSNNKKFKEKKPIRWVKNSPNGLLLGNKCMEKVKQEMGFEYELQSNSYQGPLNKMNEFYRFWHNLAAKTRIMLKNGPFWKSKLKRKQKECRQLTGDYMG